jgi:hypothetical protein
MTRAMHRLYFTHAASRVTFGRGGFAIPSRFLLEIPPGLLHGPRLVAKDEDLDDDQRPPAERTGGILDLDVVFGRDRGGGSRGRAADGRERNGQRPIGPRHLPPGGGFAPPPGAPPAGTPFRPSRDLDARRASYYGSERRTPPRPTTAPAPPVPPAPRASRPIVPGERRYRDGDRVRHAAFGDGRVVSSRLTRDDEEVTVAFPDRGVKVLLGSLANLELLG